MATPEREKRRTDASFTEDSYKAAVALIERQLEVADENENVIERTFTRDQLLERKDELEAEFRDVNSLDEMS